MPLYSLPAGPPGPVPDVFDAVNRHPQNIPAMRRAINELQDFGNILIFILAQLSTETDTLDAHVSGFDWPELGAGASEITTVPVTGAELGDYALASLDIAVTTGLTMTAEVTAHEVVTVTLFNGTAAPIDQGSGTLSVRVFPSGYTPTPPS